MTTSNSYIGEDAFREMQSGPSSGSTRALDLDEGRHTLQKAPPGAEGETSFMGRKRFSKRQSKSGLSAVF